MTEPLATLWTRFGQELVGLSAMGWGTGVVVGAAVVFALLRWPARWVRWQAPARWAALGVVCAAALAWAWSLRWIADDAFISFRYARNLVEGHGLVFNPGEVVEGYTNFLWTALIALAFAFGVPPGIASVALSLLALIAALLLTTRIGTIVSPRRTRTVLPIGALLLASSYVFVSFGTSGLETMLAAALVLLSLERALCGHPLQAGLAGVLATMAHPDHGLFYAALGLALGLDGRSRRELLRFALPFVTVYVPYFLARWGYYGSFFPNTYHAKSAGDFYFSQGMVYLLVCTAAAGIVGWAPMFLTGLHAQRRKLLGRFLLVAVPAYVLYLLKIGGDFMLGRLLVPLLPLLALTVEAGARHLVATRRFPCAAVGVALAATSALPLRFLRPAEKLYHIADERTFYPIERLHPLRIDSPFTAWSDRLLETFGEGPNGPLTATGCVGIVAYRTGYPMLDVFGLTDPQVARQPVLQRGRPGHEKLASPAYLIERGVMITDQIVYPPEYAKLTEVQPGFLPLHLVGYREDLVRSLRAVGQGGLADMPEVLRAYQPPVSDPARVACDLWFFEMYYFAHQPPQVRKDFVRGLRERGTLSPRAADMYALPEQEMPAGWQRAAAIDFSNVDLRAWLRAGSAFDRFPSHAPAQGQAGIAGRVGPFANSFTDEQGDAAIGALQSPPFRIEGDVITLRVGGGRDADRLRVMLIVDGHDVAHATGCGSEILGRRHWDVAEHRGKEARLMVVDLQSQGWGHVLVDEVEVWRTEP